MIKQQIKKTDFLTLTELWQDGDYLEVGDIIFAEDWSHARLAEFCLYFVKYIGLNEFQTLYKFLNDEYESTNQ